MSKVREFPNGSNALTVYTYGEDTYITARAFSSYVDAPLAKADAPAFALAVLEAAGYAEGFESAWTALPSHVKFAVRSLKDHLKAQEQAAEEETLDKEAESLAKASWAGFPVGADNWAKASREFKDVWRAVARKARELHKTEASK